MPKKKTAKSPQRRDAFEPRTKAEWLREEFFPDDPEFPLDAEIIAACPEELPGELPTTDEEYIAGDEPDDADELLEEFDR
jgi:hypothetical protein